LGADETVAEFRTTVKVYTVLHPVLD